MAKLMFLPDHLWDPEDKFLFKHRGIRPVCWDNGLNFIRVEDVIRGVKGRAKPVLEDEYIVYDGPYKLAPSYLKMEDVDDLKGGTVTEKYTYPKEGGYRWNVTYEYFLPITELE